MDNTSTLYDQVVDVTSDYLGPASRRFIDRQITNHLEKRPEDINQNDLHELIDWIKAAIAVLTEDKKLIHEFTERLQKLTNNHVTA